MNVSMTGLAGLAAFVCCRDTPTMDPDLDVHVDVMHKLRPWATAQKDTPNERLPMFSADLRLDELRYIARARDMYAEKSGFPDIMVVGARELKSWAKETIAKMEVAEKEAAAQPKEPDGEPG